jgi:ribosome-binding factor A
MSSDLRIARIYFTTPGGQTGRDAAAKGFECAAGFVKRTLARQLALRYMPDLKFFYDESFDYGTHIDGLLESIKKKNGTDYTPPE